MAFRRSPQLSPPAHWSETFVEHLRTVHFALIATTVGLLVVALTTKPFSTEVAKYQLHRLLHLKRQWGANFMRNEFGQVRFPNRTRKQLLDAIGEGFDIKLSNVDRFAADIDIQKNCCFVQDDEMDLANPRGKDIHAKAAFPSDMVYLRTPSDAFAKKATNAVPETMPDGLSEIGFWWDELGESSVEYYFPLSISDLGVVTDENDSFKGKIRFSRIDSNTVEDFIFPHDEDQKHPVMMTLEPSYELSQQEGHQPDVVLQFTSEYHGDKVNKHLKIHGAVTAYVYSELNAVSLARYLGVDSTKFNRAFYDLLQVAGKNGAYTLPEIDEVLSKSDLSETPVFEAFGIKFPADLATLGGIVALLSVQLYLFVYLRRLRGSLKQDDPGWNVPWIGMDPSGLCRMIFFVTVVIFPAVSLLVLGSETSLRLTRIYWDWAGNIFHHDPVRAWSWAVKLKLLALIASVLLSGLLGILSWKYRPQIANTLPSTTANPPA